MLAVKRMRRRAGVFAAIFGVVAILAGLSVGLSGYITGAASAGVMAGVNALSGSDGGFRVSTELARDASAQDAAVRAAVRSAVQLDGRPVPVTVRRDIVTREAIPLDRADGAPIRTDVASIPDLSSRARLIAGVWPTTSNQASIQADAAAILRVAVGDVLTLPNGDPLTITGTWRVSSATDPRWLEDPVALSGVDVDSTPGWVVIDPSEWSATEVRPLARWTVRPIGDQVTLAELPALQNARDTVFDAVQRQHPHADVQSEGRLDFGLLPIQQNVHAAAAVSVAPLVALALLGLITLIELSGMLTQLRSAETLLLRARGASRRRFISEAVGEGLLTAVPAAAIGSVAAAVILAAHGGSIQVPVVGVVASSMSVFVAVLVLALSAAQASNDVLPGSRKRLGALALRGGRRLTTTATSGALLLVLLLAVVAISQFMLYGSPLAPVSGGGVAIDPLAVSAPALAISSIALLAVGLFPLVARGLERAARRASGLSSLPLQQLARRSRSALTPILVLAFGVSGLILGTCYSGTWAASAYDTRQVQIGTSVRVTSSPPLSESIAQPVAGQRGAAPVARQDAQLGDELVPVLGIPDDRIAATVNPVGEAVDPTRLAAALGSDTDRPRVPVAATGLRVSFAGLPSADLPTGGSLLLVDAVGAETAVNLLPDSADSLSGTLPAGVIPWTVHGIRLLLPELDGGVAMPVQLQATGGSSASIPLDSSWRPPTVSSQDGEVPGPSTAALSDGRAGLGTTRAGPGGYVLLQSVHADTARLPVVISQSLADSTGLRTGAHSSMLLVTRGGSVPVRIAGIVPVIPGIESGKGILTDLGALQDAAVREGLLDVSSGEWWISATNPARVAAAEKTAQPDADIDAAVPSAAEQVLESARVVVWIAGIATALLAFLAIGSGLLAELRSRRDEARVLRAVGVSPRLQSAGRVREWSLLLGFGIVAGVIDGVVVCALMVRQLARTAVPSAIDGLPTVLSLDLAGAAIALGALVVAVVGLLVLLAVRVRREGRTNG